MNAEELKRRSENGRQSRNDTVLVILRKKFRQPTVEKLDPSAVSKGCGNGVGRAGGDEGTVGMLGDAALAVDGGELAETVDEGVVGKAMFEIVDDGFAWGSGLRLCGLHLNICQSEEGGGVDKRSATASCVTYRVDAVMRIRISGTRKTAHLILRPATRLFSSTKDGTDIFFTSSWPT